jgi:CheY-like chemotaxis protein
MANESPNQTLQPTALVHEATRLVKLYLERTNHYVVREENDPKTALSAAEEFLPHLILLDVKMPGLDGWDLAGCFQASPKLKAVPIVFLTAAITKGELRRVAGGSGGTLFWPSRSS